MTYTLNDSIRYFDDFLIFFAVAIALLFAFTWIYVKITPYKEITLIREGNHAAAISLSGAMLGFALPLSLIHTSHREQSSPCLDIAQQRDVGVALVRRDEVVDGVYRVARAFEALQRVCRRHTQVPGDAQTIVAAQTRGEDLLRVGFSERRDEVACVDEADEFHAQSVGATSWRGQTAIAEPRRHG